MLISVLGSCQTFRIDEEYGAVVKRVAPYGCRGPQPTRLTLNSGSHLEPRRAVRRIDQRVQHERLATMERAGRANDVKRRRVTRGVQRASCRIRNEELAVGVYGKELHRGRTRAVHRRLQRVGARSREENVREHTVLTLAVLADFN